MPPAQTNQPGLPGLSANLVPEIVSNIPVHNPDAAHSPIREDEESDKIMQAASNELKKDDNRPAKKHFQLLRKTKQKEIKFTAQPLAIAQKPAPLPPSHPITKPQNQSLPVKSQPTAPKLNSLPVFTIFVTIVVTIVLMAAAIAAYKK